MDRVFSALGDPTRCAIVERLLAGPAPVNTLVEGTGLSQPAVSRHLKVLTDAGLIDREQRGKERLCQLNPTSIAAIDNWLRPFAALWEDRFARLDTFLEAEEGQDVETQP